MKTYSLFAMLISLSIIGCDKPVTTKSPSNTGIPTIQTDGWTLAEKIGPKDSVVAIRIDSKKPAKVEIFRCSIVQTLTGPAVADSITLSFLHFPNCRRMIVGQQYTCVIRHNSGTGYSLVRSDMLSTTGKEILYNYFWLTDSEEAKQIEDGIKRYIQSKSE